MGKYVTVIQWPCHHNYGNSLCRQTIKAYLKASGPARERENFSDLRHNVLSNF